MKTLITPEFITEVQSIWRAGERARRAYYTDRIVAAGLCAACGHRRTKTSGHRRCWSCAKAKRAAA